MNMFESYSFYLVESSDQSCIEDQAMAEYLHANLR